MVINRVKARNNGFSTLILTATISLLMALYAFSLLGVEAFNIKKAQNVIVAKELKAKANATFQCALEIIMTSKSVTTSHDFTSCSEGTVNVTQIGATKKYKITAKAIEASSNGEAIASGIVMTSSNNGPTAAFASSGDISFNVSQTIDPYEGSKNGNGYDCSAIRTGGVLELLAGADLIVRHPHDQSGQRKQIDNQVVSCNSTHKTESPQVRNDYLADIQENIQDLDLFEENFSVPREEWQSVLHHFEQIHGELTSQLLPDGRTVEYMNVPGCGGKINAIVESNKTLPEDQKTRYIWVNGTCDLQGMNYSQVADNADAVTVVVQDGLLYSSDNVYFHGNMYLFDIGLTNDQLLAAWAASGLASFLPGQDLASVPFFFRGSFITRGAFNLDSPNRTSHVFGSFQPGYSKGKVDYEDSTFGKLVVLDGSWHDF